MGVDVPNVPTEMMRSWVGQDVTVLAYSAGIPATPAMGTPAGVPGSPQPPTSGGTPGTPAAASPGDVVPGYFPVLKDFHGRLDDISGFGVALTTQDGTVAFFPWQAF